MKQFTVALGLLALVLSGCPEIPKEQKGNISGTVGFPTAASTLANTADIVPGDVIVKFKTGIRSASRLDLRGINLNRASSSGLGSTFLYRSSIKMDVQATLEMVQNLQVRSDVEYAQANYIYHIAKVPRDTFFSLQWHYPAINLPQTWDLVDGTKGEPVVVAVVDSGILWAGDTSPKTHPDLIGKVLPGVDLISDPLKARDGDGRDSDPFDVGDLLESPTQSSYHGSHVAGTIAASTDNLKTGSSTQAFGVAGVSWGAKILPVRVLGLGNIGSTLAVIDGILWAAGIDVPGVPHNNNPAAIINLSLGAKAPCVQLPAEQDALNQVRAKGVIVVVAAGNENEDAANSSPASCAGVITVGATDLPGARAPYSNFGTRIDVMAPGGDSGIDTNNDGRPDGVLSLHKDDLTNTFNFIFNNGTSMATPHVSGVIALMKALRPNLTPDQAINILRDTASLRTDVQCQGREHGSQIARDCGAGLIDAFKAATVVNGLPNPDFNLTLSQSGLTIAPAANANLNLEINCSGGLTGLVNLGTAGKPDGVTIKTSPAANCGSSLILNIAVDANVASKTYPMKLFGKSGLIERSVNFSLTVQSAPPSVKNTFVGALFVNANDEVDKTKSKSVVISELGSSAIFNLADLEPGNYTVFAWKDLNADNKVNTGDLVGIEPNLVRPSKTDLSLKLEPFDATKTKVLANFTSRDTLPKIGAMSK